MVVGVLALVAAPRGRADAHSTPGGRTIVAQPECGALAVLATYRPPSGTRGDTLGMLVKMARPKQQRAYAEAAMTLRAIGPLRVEIDGVAAAWEDVRVKLVEDPPGSGRAAGVVLATLPIPDGEHVVRLIVDDAGEHTATSWIDRSSGRIAEAGPSPAGETMNGSVTLDWRWSGSCERQ
jgi:hypothetical protein